MSGKIDKEDAGKMDKTPLAAQTTDVYLRVYDLTNGMAKVVSKQLLGVEVDGVWHTSIEIFEKEYFFHGNLRKENIGQSSFGTLVDRVHLGQTDCVKSSFEEFFYSCNSTWDVTTYDLFEKNCNHFTNFLANFLVNTDIPEYIRHLPEKVKKSKAFREMFK